MSKMCGGQSNKFGSSRVQISESKHIEINRERESYEPIFHVKRVNVWESNTEENIAETLDKKKKGNLQSEYDR